MRLRGQPSSVERLDAALREAGAATDLVFGAGDARLAAVQTLREIGTSRAQNLLQKTHDGAADDLIEQARKAFQSGSRDEA